MYTALDCLIDDYNHLRGKIVNTIKLLIVENDGCGIKLFKEYYDVSDKILSLFNYIIVDDDNNLVCKEKIEGGKSFYLSQLKPDVLLDVLEGLYKQLGLDKDE